MIWLLAASLPRPRWPPLSCRSCCSAISVLDQKPVSIHSIQCSWCQMPHEDHVKKWGISFELLTCIAHDPLLCRSTVGGNICVCWMDAVSKNCTVESWNIVLPSHNLYTSSWKIPHWLTIYASLDQRGVCVCACVILLSLLNCSVGACYQRLFLAAYS